MGDLLQSRGKNSKQKWKTEGRSDGKSQDLPVCTQTTSNASESYALAGVTSWQSHAAPQGSLEISHGDNITSPHGCWA